MKSRYEKLDWNDEKDILKNRQLVKEQDSVIDAFSSIYEVVWLFDLEENTMKVIHETNNLLDPAGEAKFEGKAAVENVIKNCVEEEFQDKMREFYDLERLAKQLESEKSVSEEFRDTILGWCRIIVIPIKKDSDGKVIELLVGIQEIDEEKQAELDAQRLLGEAYKEAKRANVAKTEFLSRMSHDIRTPINGILGMSTIARKSIDNKKQVLYALSKIDEAGEQLELLINDVLDMSRLESGRTELSHELFEVENVLRIVYDSIITEALRKGIKVKRAYQNQNFTKVMGSPLHLQRVLLNILSNAIKYNKPDGSVEVNVSQKMLDDTHVEYCFKIQDTGAGMSPEFVKRIFEPFSREKKDVGTTYQGTGLGMAIAKEMVELMEGTIKVESELGIGSTFTIKIPFEMPREERLKINEERKPEEDCVDDVSLKGKRILVVEDNALNIEIAEFILEEAQAEIVIAQNGKEAVYLYRESPEGYFDLILMDIMMPEMNGLEATKMIRSLHREDASTIPIIAMTANAFKEDIEKCKEAGMNEHIAKPLHMDKMLAIIKELCKKGERKTV